MQFRIGVNVYGAPAMTLQRARADRPAYDVRRELTMSIPVGQYDPAKLINLGTNRWAFKPEVGFTHNSGRRWLFEVYGGVWLFTDNNEFFGGSVRAQQPIGSVQFHVRYTFKPGLWLSANSNFYSGGRTTVDGTTQLRPAAQLARRRDVQPAALAAGRAAHRRQPRRLHDNRRGLRQRVGRVTPMCGVAGVR